MGGAQATKRALVKVILALALTRGVQLSVNRDSPDPAVLSALRRVESKLGPQRRVRGKKPGTGERRQLDEARKAWEDARASAGKSGRPRSRPDAARGPAAGAEGEPEVKDYRIQSQGVMITIHGFTDRAQRLRFVAFVEQSKARWKVKHWCATLERCKNGTLHVHLYVQFSKTTVDTSVSIFKVEDLRPRGILAESQI